MLKGELLGPFIDLFLSLAFIQKVQQGEITAIPTVKHFNIESEGWFLVDTGSSYTVINLELLPKRDQVLSEINWVLNRAPVSTVTDRVNLPVCKTTIEIKGRKLPIDKAFIITRGIGHHLLGMDILTSLGKSITLDLAREILYIT